MWVLNQFSIPSLHLIYRFTNIYSEIFRKTIQMLLYYIIIRWEPNICFDFVEIEILHSEIRVWTKIWHWSFVQENRAQKSAEGDEMCFIWIFSFSFGMRTTACVYTNQCLVWYLKFVFLQTYNFLVDIERCIWLKLIYWRKKIIRPCLLRRIMAH